MPRTRPPSITVIAILQLVFGGLMVVLYICGGLMQLAGGQAMFSSFSNTGNAKANNQMQIQKEFQEGVERIQAQMPGGKMVEHAKLCVDILLTLMMIIGGIGLLKMLRWSHTLTILYAVLSILMKIAANVYALLYVLPAMSAFL